MKEGETISKNAEMGKRIKSIRKRLGKSQEEFGQLFDPPAPKSSVSYWENGGGPNKKRLKKIAELGGVSVEYLINGNRLSADEFLNLFDKALRNPADLTKKEKQELSAAQLDVFSTMKEFTRFQEKQAQNRISEEQATFNEHPLSIVDLQTYGFFLSLFNLIRIYGTDDQGVSFGSFINVMWQIAVGKMKYDKNDILTNVDKLLSSFPIKKDDSDESK